ncbi:hypothetical protein DFH06DRAFT_1338038 [Mycena polygramma]|nr:hypothetical protein DFH06DRAFT_1338038 [Mycena polygramma]
MTVFLARAFKSGQSFLHPVLFYWQCFVAYMYARHLFECNPLVSKPDALASQDESIPLAFCQLDQIQVLSQSRQALLDLALTSDNHIAQIVPELTRIRLQVLICIRFASRYLGLTVLDAPLQSHTNLLLTFTFNSTRWIEGLGLNDRHPILDCVVKIEEGKGFRVVMGPVTYEFAILDSTDTLACSALSAFNFPDVRLLFQFFSVGLLTRSSSQTLTFGLLAPFQLMSHHRDADSCPVWLEIGMGQLASQTRSTWLTLAWNAEVIFKVLGAFGASGCTIKGRVRGSLTHKSLPRSTSPTIHSSFKFSLNADSDFKSQTQTLAAFKHPTFPFHFEYSYTGSTTYIEAPLRSFILSWADKTSPAPS